MVASYSQEGGNNAWKMMHKKAQDIADINPALEAWVAMANVLLIAGWLNSVLWCSIDFS